jgi:alginate O-acetyltransferase complex protein AlgI
MLFNSYSFIFVYLPLVLLGAAWLGWKLPKLVVPWLGMASLAFYGVWNVRFVSFRAIGPTRPRAAEGC